MKSDSQPTAQPCLRLLVVTQYFAPENFRINDLVTGLVAKGHRVTVLTGQPNYPSGDFFPGYGWRGPRHESLLGAHVIRVPMVARRRGGALRLVLNYLSFAMSACHAAVFRLQGDYDAIFVFEPSPVTVGFPAIAAARRFRIPILFWVLDLWPASLQAAGAVHSPFLLSLASRVVRWIYARCDLVLMQSRAFVEDLARHGVSNEKIRYFPNWVEPVYGLSEQGEFPTVLPAGFRIVYAGNIGAAQGFPEILAAAEEIARACPQVRWIIAGDGRMADWVREEVRARGLGDKFMFLGQMPASAMPSLFEAADALLVGLRAAPAFAQTIPGKVQSYLAAGKPILAMLDGEGARVVEEAGAGLTSPSSDHGALVDNVKRLVAMPRADLLEMGLRGRTYAQAEFGRAALFDKLESWVRAAMENSQCKKT